MDELLNAFLSIPKDTHCDSAKEIQQKIMHCCWLYNQLVSEKLPCSVCKWNVNRNNIEKYLKGCGKL